jgi:multisubunit Na+/H+ antiporter MnhC subunit
LIKVAGKCNDPKDGANIKLACCDTCDPEKKAQVKAFNQKVLDEEAVQQRKDLIKNKNLLASSLSGLAEAAKIQNKLNEDGKVTNDAAPSKSLQAASASEVAVSVAASSSSSSVESSLGSSNINNNSNSGGGAASPFGVGLVIAGAVVVAVAVLAVAMVVAGKRKRRQQQLDLRQEEHFPSVPNVAIASL